MAGDEGGGSDDDEQEGETEGDEEREEEAFERVRAANEREAKLARMNDPEETIRIEEAAARDRAIIEFERAWADGKMREDGEERKALEEELETKEKLNHAQRDGVNDDDDGWEYVEEGPAEIIWKGNEIILKKKKVRVLKGGPTKNTRGC